MRVRQLPLEPLLLPILLLTALVLVFPSHVEAQDTPYPFLSSDKLFPPGGLLQLSPNGKPKEPPQAPESQEPPQVLQVQQPPQAPEPQQAPQAPEPQPPPPQPPTSLEPERPKPEKPIEQLLLERGAILLPQGILQIEPSIEYAHLSQDRVEIAGFTVFEAIVIGTIRVDDLQRDIVTGYLTTRYGILDRLQADLRVPYVWRQDQEVLGVGTIDEQERTIDNNDFGDVEASVSWQALIGREWIPDIIVRAVSRFPTGEDPFEVPTETLPGGEIRFTKPPTGSGFWGVGPGATFVWRSDPAVFFVGMTYLFNLPRDVNAAVGEIDPADTFQWLVGINFALSERVAVNLSFIDEIAGSSQQNGQDIAGSSFNDGRLVLGASIGLSPTVTLIVGAGAGLTDDSPDFTFTVAVPISFKLF